MDCGWGTLGYGGTFLDYGTGYTTSSSCGWIYLLGTYYVGQPHQYGVGWTTYNQNDEIEGVSAAAQHRLCTWDWTICSFYRGTSDS